MLSDGRAAHRAREADGDWRWDFPRAAAGTALLARFAAERGVPGVLDGSGLTPDDLARPGGEVEAAQELAVVRALAAALPDAGLAVGRRYHATTFGVLGFALLTCATVLDAVETARRHLDLSFAFCALAAEFDGARLVVVLDDSSVPGDIARFLAERDLAAVRTVLDDLVPGGVQVSEVDFGFPEPADTAPHRSLFGVRPRFGAPRTRMALPLVDLLRPSPLANPETAAACAAECRDLSARRRARTGVLAAVRQVLDAPDGLRKDMAAVARDLHMSSRTLRRRLADTGTSYNLLVDDLRRVRAEDLLATSTLSVREIAHALGYAEPACLTHAFRRWTGTTPRDFRRALA